MLCTLTQTERISHPQLAVHKTIHNDDNNYGDYNDNQLMIIIMVIVMINHGDDDNNYGDHDDDQ